MEKAGMYKEYENNFVLNETHVRKIHQIFEQYSHKIDSETTVSINISRDDNSYFETEDIEKILSDENEKGKEITSLSMDIILSQEVNEEKKSTSERTAAIISFNKNKDTKIKFVTSYHSRDWCFLLTDEIDAQVQRALRNKPNRLFKSKFVDFVFAIIVVFVIFPFIPIFLGSNGTYDSEQIMGLELEEKINFLIVESIMNSSSFNIWTIPITALLLILFIATLEFKPLSKIVKISNISAFYWGDMILRFDEYEKLKSKIKWGIGITFLVSLSASMLVYLVT